MNISKYCVVEYSHSQQQFHCDFLNASIKTNIQSVKNNRPSDWITIGIFKNLEEANEFIKEFKEQLNSIEK